ncbi:MAG TPA: type II CAAX endopeptidase family protein [Myxococcaceae bacterium]|nr:type II CAAX endopeptidase family protein [Myxococcaceae bacterium]
MSDLPEVPLPPSAEPLPQPIPPSHPSRARGQAIALCALLFALFLFVGVPIQLLHAPFGIWFVEVFLFFGVTWVLMRLSGRDPVRYPRFAFPGIRLCLLGFLVGTINLFAVVIPLQSFFQWLSPKWLVEIYDQAQIFKNQTPVELFVIVAGVSLAAPVCEEYFFRGVFQQGLMRQPERPWGVLLISSAVFSAFHLDPIGFTARVELGVLFGYLLYRTGSLWPGIFAHAANNLVSTGAYFATRGLEGGEEAPNPFVLAGMAVLLTPVLILALRYTARTPAPVPEMREEPRVPFLKLVLPWVAAALASVVLLVLVDRRGVALNVYDLAISVQAESKSPSPEELKLRAELRAARGEARAGRIPLASYAEKRRETAKRLSLPGELPVPPSVFPPAPTQPE